MNMQVKEPPTLASQKTTSPSTKNPGGSGKPWAFRDLPPFPGVALQILSLLDDAEVPMKKISDLLRMDPALSAEILRVSNSAMYGVSRRIDNVSHAIVVLGTETVKRLALTVALGRFCHEFLGDKSLRVCWDHSVACALIAQELADLLEQPKDRAYTAGMLHDVGRLAILACFPREYGNMLAVARENGFDELEIERELFDIDHCAAGAILAGEWNLPEDFIEAISTHHEAPIEGSSIPSMITAANELADLLGYSVLQLEQFDRSISDVVASLPIEDKEAAVERIEGFQPTIQTALSSITPT